MADHRYLTCRSVLTSDKARVMNARDAARALAAEAKSVVNEREDLINLVRKYRPSGQ